MEILQRLFKGLQPVIPLGAAILGVVVVLLAVRYIFEKRYGGRPGYRLRREVITMVLSFIGLLVVIMTLPVSDTTVGQLLSLIGILLSATIALSAPNLCWKYNGRHDAASRTQLSSGRFHPSWRLF